MLIALIIYLLIIIIIILSITLTAKKETTVLINNLNKQAITSDFELNKQFRIEYYMGKWFYTAKSIDISKIKKENRFSIHSTRDNYFYYERKNVNIFVSYYDNYYYDMDSILHKNNNDKGKLLALFGDNTNNANNLPIITKARKIGDDHRILFKLKKERHFRPIYSVNLFDIPFSEKNDNVIWRGITTGRDKLEINDRYQYVSKYFDKYNIRYSGITQGWDTKLNKKYKKIDKVTMQDQLRYKYLISLEGNDVASGLKWMLFSNSVVLMPHPIKETWACEGLLKPYIHYVPINPDNLDYQMDWCRSNQKRCEDISKNATKFILQFCHLEMEQEIHNSILEKYHNNFIMTKKLIT